MPMMNLFEPLFLLLALTTVITVLTAVVYALTGRFGRAGRILKRLLIGAAVCFSVVIIVSAVQARRIYQVGDPQCFDDWCITVMSGHWIEPPPSQTFEVVLRLSSRAKRVPMGEKGTVVYVTDRERRRFDPRPGAAVPLDAMLQPGESIDAVRRFDIPRDAAGLGLVFTHEGGFPIGWLIITEGGWFAKPPIVMLTP